MQDLHQQLYGVEAEALKTPEASLELFRKGWRARSAQFWVPALKDHGLSS